MAASTAGTMQSAALASQLAVLSGAAEPRSSGLSLARIPRSRLLKSQSLRLAKVLHGQRADSKRQFLVSAEYSGRRGGGAGDFVAGFLLGGVLFGAIGYLIAPAVKKLIAAPEKEIQEDEEIEGPPKKLPKYVQDEGLEGFSEDVNHTAVELESAA